MLLWKIFIEAPFFERRMLFFALRKEYKIVVYPYAANALLSSKDWITKHFTVFGDFFLIFQMTCRRLFQSSFVAMIDAVSFSLPTLEVLKPSILFTGVYQKMFESNVKKIDWFCNVKRNAIFQLHFELTNRWLQIKKKKLTWKTNFIPSFEFCFLFQASKLFMQFYVSEEKCEKFLEQCTAVILLSVL